MITGPCVRLLVKIAGHDGPVLIALVKAALPMKAEALAMEQVH